MSLRRAKWDNSSSRQRDVTELIFTCDIVMSLLLWLLESESAELEEEWCGDVADPTGATRCPEPGGEAIMLSRWRRCSSECTD